VTVTCIASISCIMCNLDSWQVTTM